MAVRELLLVVAALTIAFGLMVSLARHVRAHAAHTLVQRELLELEDALAVYRAAWGGLPPVPDLFPPPAGLLATDLFADREPELRQRALEQNRELVRTLGVGALRGEGQAGGALGGVTAMMFDGSTLLDPWGRPIAYLSAGRAEIGTAAGNAAFFFSAGPDGEYLTREDNVYSYEVLAAGPVDDAGEAADRSAGMAGGAGGQPR